MAGVFPNSIATVSTFLFGAAAVGGSINYVTKLANRHADLTEARVSYGSYGKLTTIFPDLKVTNLDILQDGNKVAVRSEMTATQRADFMGIPAKGRILKIMAIDIHEFKDGKIIRTWHIEDWLTGLQQLGAFEK
jgi:steroid delta-isomerase-like uncharacterized protein